MTRWMMTPLLLVGTIGMMPIGQLLADEPKSPAPAPPGTVEFLFDGGTLQCTFGAEERDRKPHVAMIVFPASVEPFAKRFGVAIDKDQTGAVVLVADAQGKFVALTKATLPAWTRSRIAEMADRPTTVAENAFVAAVSYAVSNAVPLQLWGAQAQEQLEAGTWTKLFARANAKEGSATNDPPR